MRGKDEPGEEGQRGRQGPQIGDPFGDPLRSQVLVLGLDRIGRRQRGNRNLARCHRRDDREADLAVEPDRGENRVEPVGDRSGDAGVELAFAGLGLRKAQQHP